MALDREKLKAVILHVCAKCDPSRLGAVKLHKVLYFADMLRYANVGKPITGATYRKRPFGPTCDSLLSVLAELERAGSLEIRNVDYFGYTKKEFVVKVAPDTNRLSEDELAIIDDVIEFVCEANSAKTISELSHNRAWEIAEFGDVMPYHSIFSVFPTQVSKEATEWALGEVKQIEASGSKPDSVDSKDYGLFRKRVLQDLGA